MNGTEFEVFNSPIAPYNEIIIATQSNLMLEVFYSTDSFIPDGDEMQFYVKQQNVNIAFQTVRHAYRSVADLLGVIRWYAGEYLGDENLEISSFPQ